MGQHQAERRHTVGRRGAAAAIVSLGLLAAVSSARAQSLAVTLPEAGGRYEAPVISYRDLPFRSVVRQQYDFSCGSAALATLLRFHYDRNIDEATAFKAMYAGGDQAQIRKLGFSLLDMKRYLESLGYTADGYRAPLAILARANTPAIVVIKVENYKHFVVVKGLTGGRVLVGDPATGLHVYSEGQFSKIWDGTLFVIHDGPAKPSFNSEIEWRYIVTPPTGALVSEQQSISTLTRNLPPIFQITPMILLSTANGGG